MTLWCHRLIRPLTSALLCVAICVAANAGDVELASRIEPVHPLSWTIRYAKSRSDFIRENVRDYSCRLIKRERIDGKLQEFQFASVKVRCEHQADDDVLPMSVFMQYLAPAKLKGRRVLYVDGENSGKMLIRKGGPAFKYLRLRIDPYGTAARRESKYPITEIGFDKIIDRLMHLVSQDIERDPAATNTKVSHFGNAKVNDRICTHIRVIHPRNENGFEFHRASLYVDDELKVPIRLVVYDWPEVDGEEPQLIEEYTYVDLKLNVGLTDEDFSEEKLE